MDSTNHEDSPKLADSSLPVLTVEEAAALLRVNHKTLREAIHRREVPGVIRLGRVIRLSRCALLQWVQGSAVLRSGEKP